MLSDKWLKHQGATMMGKAGGESKARSEVMASKAAKARWAKHKPVKKEQPDREKAEKAFATLRTLAGVKQPKRKRT